MHFESMTSASEAISHFHDKEVDSSGRKIILKWLDTEESRLGIGQNSDYKLFVASLPRQAKIDDLYEIFSKLGTVESVRLESEQYWAFVDYKHKESAILAIKYLNGQVYLHGSMIPIDVRFKEKKYNSFMQKKQDKTIIDPFTINVDNLYY